MYTPTQLLWLFCVVINAILNDVKQTVTPLAVLSSQCRINKFGCIVYTQKLTHIQEISITKGLYRLDICMFMHHV